VNARPGSRQWSCVSAAAPMAAPTLMRDRFLQALLRWASRQLPQGAKVALADAVVDDRELAQVLNALVVAQGDALDKGGA